LFEIFRINNTIKEEIYEETDKFTAKLAVVGNYYIYKLKSNEKSQQKPKIMNVLVVDNSGSMGRATYEASFATSSA